MARKLILLIGLLAATAVFLFLYLLPSFRFLKLLQKKLEGPSSGEISRSEVQIPEAGLSAHIYRPPQDAVVTLIMVPGLHPEGIYDSRFRAFADTCAEKGFQVVAPDIREFRDFHVTMQSVDQLAALIESLPQHFPKRSLRKVGALGISYGAGPLFLVTARPEIKSKLHFLVSIGGYYSLQHAIYFTLTGTHPGSTQARITHQWGRMIFARNYIEQLAPSTDRALLQKSLTLRLDLREPEAEKEETQLSAEGKAFLKNVLQGLSASEQKAFLRILDARAQAAYQFSPESVLSQLDPRLRIYLLHGRNDDLIPYEETEELQQALRKIKHTRTHTLITGSLTHVDVKKTGNLTELIRLLFWIRSLLSEASA